MAKIQWFDRCYCCGTIASSQAANKPLLERLLTRSPWMLNGRVGRVADDRTFAAADSFSVCNGHCLRLTALPKTTCAPWTRRASSYTRRTNVGARLYSGAFPHLILQPQAFVRERRLGNECGKKDLLVRPHRVAAVISGKAQDREDA